jgi:hypothetical protein
MNLPDTPQKRGRPKYRLEYGEQAYHLCLLGATNPHIAKALNVSLSTVEKWIAKKPEFAERIHAGRIAANATIAESLFIRARGQPERDRQGNHAEHVRTLMGRRSGKEIRMSMRDRNKAIAFDFIRDEMFPGLACPAPADVVRAVRAMKRELEQMKARAPKRGTKLLPSAR